MNLDDILDRPIAFHRCFVELTGSVNAALMLSQAFYWSKRSKESDRSFYKSIEEWQDETGLSRHEQDGARQKLRKFSFWKETKKGIPCRLFFIVDRHLLREALKECEPANKFAENRQTGVPEIGNPASEISATYKGTETTSETITEKNESPRSSREVEKVKSQEYSDVAIQLFEERYGQPPRWGNSHYVQLARLLKLNPVPTVDEFRRRYRLMLSSQQTFHQQQAGSLQYFCTHFDSFIEPITGGNGNGRTTKEQRTIEAVRNLIGRTEEGTSSAPGDNGHRSGSGSFEFTT